MTYDFCCIEDNLHTCDLCNESIDHNGHDCENRRHKWPTLEQFRNDWGYEWPKDGAVYEMSDWDWPVDRVWRATSRKHCLSDSTIVCACTPHSKPDGEWRPP